MTETSFLADFGLTDRAMLLSEIPFSLSLLFIVMIPRIGMGAGRSI
jgi:hypothetical protein